MSTAERPRSWRDSANCSTTDPELFFPGPGDSVRPAVRVCERCDVLTECLAYAMSLPHDDDWGVLGGMSQAERRQLRKTRQGTAA